MTTTTVIEDIETRAKAMAEAKAEETAQIVAHAAVRTERYIQCQKAHELIDLWFSTWDEEKAKRWAVLSSGAGDGSTDLTPNVDHVLAVLGLCLAYAPVRTVSQDGAVSETA